MKKKKTPNEIPEAHLEEDKESPGEESGAQEPAPLGQVASKDPAGKGKTSRRGPRQPRS